MIAQILSKNSVISKQVTAQQVEIILNELDRVLMAGQPGAIVEFGCYIGTTSLFIRRLLDARQGTREFHVYDSFEGLPAKAPEDASAAGEQFIAGELAVGKKAFLSEFHKAKLAPPVIHKGWFSELTAKDVPAQIAFAFLDGDFYDSMIDSLALVLPRMAPGGAIVLDDYAHDALPGVAKALKAIAPDLVPRVHVTQRLGIIRL